MAEGIFRLTARAVFASGLCSLIAFAAGAFSFQAKADSADGGMDIAVGKGLHLKQVDGSWVQLAHYIPKTKKTDVCVASARDQTLVLRIAAHDMQLRTYNSKWHLKPQDTTGMDIVLGSYKAHFNFTYLDKRGFVAPVSFEEISTLLNALEKGQAGTLSYTNPKISVKSRRVRKINTAKAEKVFYDFRHCVRDNHFAPLAAPLPLKKNSKKQEKIVFPKLEETPR